MEIIKQLSGSVDSALFQLVISKIYSEAEVKLKSQEKLVEKDLYACYFAIENNEVSGRACLFMNEELKFENFKTASLGHYEFAENSEESLAFLKHIESEAKSLGIDYLIGPMNGSTWENYRFSLDHNSPNFLLEPYHHLYYNEQFKNFGFETIASYKSNREDSFVFDFPELIAHESEMENKGLIIRPINLADYSGELRKLYPFITTSFASNFLYSHIEWEEFYEKYSEAKKIIDQDFVLIAEYEEKVVGFVFAYQDLMNRNEKSLVIKTLARHPDEKWKGLGEILGNRILRSAYNRGFTNQIHAFMKDTNRSVATSGRFHGFNYKKYALYGKKI